MILINLLSCVMTSHGVGLRLEDGRDSIGPCRRALVGSDEVGK
jgi:hypothetical protein